MTVNPSLPAKSVQDIINLAKAQPGKLVFSSSGAGTSSHLTMELFKSAAKIDMLHVPYKGGAPAVNAVMSGEAQMTFNVITGTLAAREKRQDARDRREQRQARRSRA